MRFEITGKASREYTKQVIEVAEAYPNLPRTKLTPKQRLNLIVQVTKGLFNRLSLDHYHFPADDMGITDIRFNKVTIHLQRMCRIKNVGVYSPRKPKVDGRLVVYTGHAAQRLAERSAANWREWPAWSNAFWLLHNRVFFENLPERKLLVAWDEVTEGSPTFELAQSFTISEYIPPDCHYKTGYLPYVEEGDKLLVCKTFLPVGFEGTPEGDWMMSDAAKNEPEIRKIWRAVAEKVMTFTGLFLEGGSIAQATFHQESPYPQLKVFRHPVIDHSEL